MSHLLWIAVPGGRNDDGDGVLRAVVIPVLDGGGTLAQEGMESWPPVELTGPDAELVVEAATEVDAEATVSIRRRPVVDVVDGLWTEFFGSIELTAPGPDMQRTLDVDQTTDHATRIVSTYSEAARELTSEDARPVFDESVRTRLTAFRQPPGSRVPQPGIDNRSGRIVDFHLATSILREHPAVLRALGLIVEITVPKATIGQMPDRGVLRVRWESAPVDVPAGQPRWTSYLRERFLPAPRFGSDVHPAGGMVKLAQRIAGEPTWRLHTVDVDHALRGLVVAANETNGGARLPALRTGGVLLARVGRAGELDRRGTRNRARNSADALTAALFAEDLTLGYRVDAKILGQSWHSLCRRVSRYSVNDVEFANDLKEEGHVKIGGGIDRGDRVLRTDEVVARWDGWSMAAPRPALRETPTRGRNQTLPFHLEADVRAEPGSLLRLRFGETYQLRARVADVAGGGTPLAEASLDDCDSEPLRFTRHEPVLPPDVRLPVGVGPFGPGASLNTLVTRSVEGIPDSVGDTTRDLVPPSASFEVIERHGRFDGDPDVSRALLARPDLADPASGGVVGFIRGERGEPPRDLETKDWTSINPSASGPDPWPDLATKQIVLRARVGNEPTLNWDNDRLLVVRLSPAEEATVEISSLIDQSTKASFSISDWLKDEDGGGASATTSEAENLLASGRHPMATPAHRITVRHAVRKPIGTPIGELAVDRAEGESFAVVGPPSEAADQLLAVDPASTLYVDVAASWKPEEDRDDPQVSKRHIARISLARGAAALAEVRHEFGDTKHRMVTYTYTASSRFRQFFGDGPNEDFQTEGTLGPVSVLSSARPVVPVVLSATPAFVWQEERPASGPIVRRRLGNRIRVELARPWFTTGDGERLAVVATPDRTPSSAEAVFLTQAGRDPLWQTEDVTRFPTPLGPIHTTTLAEGFEARLVAHGVWSVGDSWYADVVMTGRSYNALVQLAVARFQPNSLLGLGISPVVRTDFVPLLPDRTLTISAQSESVAVRLEGIAPIGPRANRVDAVLERRLTETPADGIPFTIGAESSWISIGTATGAVGATLTLAAPASLDGLRVRVREVESIGAVNDPVLGSIEELEERVVFTDTVEL